MINCEQCHIGRYKPITAPYLSWIGDRIMVIPDAPARVCDICGQPEYAPDFLSQIQYFLNQFAADEPQSDMIQRQLMMEGPASWQPEGVDNFVC